MNAFIKANILINPKGYDINLILLDLLHSKMLTGDNIEDPYEHVEYFVCKLFCRTLTGDKARAWYNDYLILNSYDWRIISTKFLQILFPETRSFGARWIITNFQSLSHENLYASYSRFREILNDFPRHDFPPLLIIQTFYEGVNVKNRDVLDLLTDGSFSEYGVDSVWNLLETIHKDERPNDSKKSDEKSLIELESINKFMQSGKVVELLGNNYRSPVIGNIMNPHLTTGL
jgi:hypothetical protein